MAIKGRWGFSRKAGTNPAADFFEITPHDTNDLSFYTRALYIGGAGDLEVEDFWGNACTFAGVPAGTVLPIRVRKVLSTGTTATAIVGLH